MNPANLAAIITRQKAASWGDAPARDQLICNDIPAMVEEITYLRTHLLDIAVQLTDLHQQITDDQAKTGQETP